MKKPILIGAVAAAAAVVAVGGVYFVRDGGDRAEDGLTLYGNVEMRQVDVGFRVPGRLEAALAEEGDHVRAGAILARLDAEPFQDAVAQAQAETAVRAAELARLEAGLRPAEIARAEARVSELQASLRVTQQTYDRRRELLASGAVSQQAFDEAAARYKEAQARVEAARKDAALAREGFRREEIAAGRASLDAAAAAADAARTSLEDSTLHAPSDAVVLARVREPGSILRAGEPVYSLALEKPIWVRAYVSETHLGRVAPGMRAEVYTDSAPNRPYAGQIGFISPVAEFTPKTVETPDLRSDLVYQVRVVVSQPDAGLRQGMPVTVRLKTPGPAR